MKTKYVVEFACDGKRFGVYETKEEAQKAVLTNVEEAPEMKRSIFDFTLKEQTTSWKDIKTFDDACRELGDKHPFVIQYKEIYDNFLDGAAPNNSCDIVTYLKLRIIVAAINEGWKPKFTEDECRWYPWFYLYDKEEYNSFSDEKKRRCVGRASGVAYALGGLVYADSIYASTYSDSWCGARLAFESEEKAEYAGETFRELWADFYWPEK